MVDTDILLPVEERLACLLQHLGVSRAHVAGGSPGEIGRLLASRPEVVASAILIRPGGFDPTPFQRLDGCLLAVYGDADLPASEVRSSLDRLPGAKDVPLPGYSNLVWQDLVADRAEAVGAATLAFLDGVSAQDHLSHLRLPEGTGEVAGLTYSVLGAGPALVLLPLGLAPTQWDALLPRLAESYCTITVGGNVGSVAALEERGRAWGYRQMVAKVVDGLELRPGQTVLEVGCGSGVLCRWLAERTSGANPITGLDRSLYLLSTAASFSKREGLDGRITFREGDAEGLPFEDASFDAAIAVTVLEEVDFERALGEMIRVTKPRGRLGVVVRADDQPELLNVPVRRELLAKVAERRWGKVEAGCADASLYQRVSDAGLRDLRCWQDCSPLYPDRDVNEFWRGNQSNLSAILSPDELREWRAAVARARDDRTLFWAPQYHCAVGIRAGR